MESVQVAPQTYPVSIAGIYGPVSFQGKILKPVKVEWALL